MGLFYQNSVGGKAGPNRKHASLDEAPVSFGDTGLPGGTGIPYSHSQSCFTAKFQALDDGQPDMLPFGSNRLPAISQEKVFLRKSCEKPAKHSVF
jgi:hypothetical protein